MKHYDIIIRPLITEKTNIQKELSNQVTFEVDRRANPSKSGGPWSRRSRFG
jgi:large subunit ribosomal protein L23